AAALAAAKVLRAGFLRFGDPVLESFRGSLVDHRAEEGFRILGIARLQFLRGRDEALFDFVIERRVHENALHADAALPRLIEAARDQARYHEIEPRFLVRVDDAGCVAAEFQHHLLLARARLEFPADLAAGEREQLQALIRDERVGIFDIAW